MCYNRKRDGCKLVIWLNVLLIVTLCTANYIYLTPGECASKTFCSGCFAALGAVNALYVLIRGGERLFSVVMALGLLLAMGGDLRIGPSFMQGAALFAAYLLLAWLSAADETQMEGFAVDAAFADSRRCIPGFLPQAGVYSRLDALGMPGICGDYFTDNRKRRWPAFAVSLAG